MLQMLQTVAGAGPEVAGAFNMVNFLRQVFRLFGVRNVNELIQKPQSISEMTGGMGGAANVPEDIGSMMQMIGGGAPSGPGSGTL
jgi:hypothetical protein